jgi:hypothetical protein
MNGRNSRRLRVCNGSVIMQALAAAAILATTLAGITSMWYISFNLTGESDEMGVAYMIGRARFENLKQNGYQTGGFQLASDGTATNYYDSAGNDITSDPTNYVFSAVTVLSTTGGLQTATVKVCGPSRTSPLYQSSTYLVKAGV